jgi:hypothetical protein
LRGPARECVAQIGEQFIAVVEQAMSRDLLLGGERRRYKRRVLSGKFYPRLDRSDRERK